MRSKDRDLLLVEIFNAIKDYNGGLTYSFKGGFILGNYICPEGARYTTDLDLSIGSLTDFGIIVDIVSPILEKWKSYGKIFSYKVKEPIAGKRSGSIDIYKKANNNSRAFIWTGLDISIHNMSYGVIRYKGFNCYSVERVLIDKISVLYADIGTIIRRSRDLYDIYLLSQLNYSMNYGNILRALEDRGIDLSRRSVFEQEIYTEEGSLVLETAINKTLVSDKVDTNWVKSYNVTSKKVIESVLHILWMLREGD